MNHSFITKALRIATTCECPLSCPICYSPKKHVHMNLKFFERILLEGRNLGFESVAFGGGEPLFSNEIEKFIEIAKNNDYITAITTSGFQVDMHKLSNLKSIGLDHLQLSLGFNRYISPGAFKLLTSQSDVDYGFNILVDPHRFNELTKLVREINQTECKYLVFILPRVSIEFNWLKFTPKLLVDYLMLLSDLQKSIDKPFFVDCATKFIQTQECPGVKHGVSISPDGKLSMCAFCNQWEPITNNLEKSILAFDINYYSGRCKCINNFLKSN